MKQLGDILLEGGLVTAEQLDAAFQTHEEAGRSLGRVLVDQGVLTEAQLVAALATQIGLTYVDLGDYPVDGSAIARVPGAVCRRHTAIPVGFEDGRIVVVMADPANIFAVNDIRTLSGYEVTPAVSTRADVLAAIDRYYRADSDLDDLTSTMEESQGTEDDLTNVKEVVEEAPIVKFVNLLITQAIQDRASDIHIEPTEHDLRVRYRIDGVLHEVMRSPKSIQSGVISRAQDHGRASTSPSGASRRTAGCRSARHGKEIDLRVATLPTVYGEKVVMRTSTPRWARGSKLNKLGIRAAGRPDR